MKKLLALILALMLALGGVSAFAGTVYTKVAVDGDVVKALLPGFGVPEEQLSMLDPIISLVNALGVKVVTVDDGGEVALDLNGKEALNLGWATDEAGATVVSTLFPNYVVTIDRQTIDQFMEQFMANMPGGQGGMGGLDFAAMGEVFGKYFAEWVQACSAAGQPGDPVPGDYVMDGVAFDTMVPVTVDVPAIKEATAKLMDELLADPAAMGMIKGMAQGMAQSSGGQIDDETFEADFRAGFEAWIAHMPETVTAEFYTNGEDGQTFYMTGESVMEGEDEPGFTYDMMFLGEANMTMHCHMGGEEAPMDMGFAMEGSDMSMYFAMGDLYYGLNLSFPENEFDMDFFFMDPQAAVLSVKVTMDDAGERSLSLDAAGKTEVTVEMPMDGNDEAVQGLLGDVMSNGVGALIAVLGEEVPEVMSLMGAFSGGAMAG